MNLGRTMNHIRNEKGVALVAALCISAVLLIFAIALTYRMATYLRMLGTSKEKNQSYYTAVTGTEQLRDRLRTSACQPPNWCDLLKLGAPADVTNPGYNPVTLFVTGVAPPATFPDTGVAGETRASYTLLLKDNDEFDNNYHTDSDELIIAVATSTGNNETRTSVEAGLLFDAESLNPYKQQGQGASRKGVTSQSDTITMQVRN